MLFQKLSTRCTPTKYEVVFFATFRDRFSQLFLAIVSRNRFSRTPPPDVLDITLRHAQVPCAQLIFAQGFVLRTSWRRGHTTRICGKPSGLCPQVNSANKVMQIYHSTGNSFLLTESSTRDARSSRLWNTTAGRVSSQVRDDWLSGCALRNREGSPFTFFSFFSDSLYGPDFEHRQQLSAGATRQKGSRDAYAYSLTKPQYFQLHQSSCYTIRAASVPDVTRTTLGCVEARNLLCTCSVCSRCAN